LKFGFERVVRWSQSGGKSDAATVDRIKSVNVATISVSTQGRTATKYLRILAGKRFQTRINSVTIERRSERLWRNHGHAGAARTITRRYLAELLPLRGLSGTSRCGQFPSYGVRQRTSKTGRLLPKAVLACQFPTRDNSQDNCLRTYFDNSAGLKA